MKTKLSIIYAILLVLVYTSTALAYDLTGMWDVTQYYRNAPRETKALIKQDGDKFTYDLFKGTVDGAKYVIPSLPPGRVDLRIAWISLDSMDFTASDEKNFKGRLYYTMYTSEKSTDVLRKSYVKIVGRKIDDPKPRILPMGGVSIFIKTGTPFKDPGVFAHDGIGESLIDEVVATGSVDSSKPGTYKISYNVTDSQGKKAPEVTRTVNVVNVGPPTITLKGDENLNVIKGTLYSDPGAKALNYLNEDISDKIKILVNGTEADPNSPAAVITSQTDVGYTITFVVEDENGKTEAVRNVMVIGSEDEQSFWSYCFISTLLD